MIDISKYNAELNSLVDFAKENDSVPVSLIKSTFSDDSLIDDVIEYLEDNDIEVERDDEEKEEYDFEGLDDENISDDELDELSDLDVDGEDELDLSEDEPTDAELSEEETDIKVSDFDAIDPTLFQTDDIVRMYLHEIGQIPLLEGTQEIEFALAVRNGRYAKEKIEQYEKNGKTISAEDMEELQKTIKVGDHAREMLITSNLRLVVYNAKKYTNRGLTLSDLIQEGSIGLMKAVDKFDPDRGCKFSTYATWWIRQAVNRAIADKGRNVRIPVHMHECINRMSKVRRHLMQELHREPTIEELAEEMKLPVDKITDLQRVARDSISFDTAVGDEEDSTLIDLVPDDKNPNPLEWTEKELYREVINDLISKLTPREEMVIRLRFGIGCDRIYTLEEVGDKMNITRERVRQIEAKALGRLRKRPQLDLIKDNLVR